jgi:hypothetical protein
MAILLIYICKTTMTNSSRSNFVTTIPLFPCFVTTTRWPVAPLAQGPKSNQKLRHMFILFWCRHIFYYMLQTTLKTYVRPDQLQMGCNIGGLRGSPTPTVIRRSSPQVEGQGICFISFSCRGMFHPLSLLHSFHGSLDALKHSRKLKIV